MPSAIELLDRLSLMAVNKYDPNLKLPDVEAALVFEIDGFKETVNIVQDRVAKICRESGASQALVPANDEERTQLWEARRLSGVAISSLHDDKIRVYDAEDVCVPISKIPEMLRSIQRISRENDLQLISYGHVGDGNLHTGITIDIRDEESWKKIEAVKEAMYSEALRLGGTLSGEHGTGFLRKNYMEKAHGESLEVMRSIKKALDPKGIMNPDKLGV
jgi:FAD/FMN-containing dehydrogenase